MQIVVTCRAIIIHEGKLLMCRQNHAGRSFFNLPGGKLEPGETIEDGLARELIEETGVNPVIGKLLFINQLLMAGHHRIEFFFRIENAGEYVDFDATKASHAHEVADFAFGDPADPKYDLKPHFLSNRFSELVARGDQFQTETIVSH